MMKSPATLQQFVQRYGHLYEHSPWLAERVWQQYQPHPETQAELLEAFQKCFNSCSKTEQLDVVQAHPDLAGKLAQSGALTADSSSEQAAAGLDQCSAAELAEFQSLNQRYRDKFEMPYILAVRNRTRQQILENFRTRVHNDSQTEWRTTLEQINQIAALRLEQIFQNDRT